MLLGQDVNARSPCGDCQNDGMVDFGHPRYCAPHFTGNRKGANSLTTFCMLLVSEEYLHACLNLDHPTTLHSGLSTQYKGP